MLKQLNSSGKWTYENSVEPSKPPKRLIRATFWMPDRPNPYFVTYLLTYLYILTYIYAMPSRARRHQLIRRLLRAFDVPNQQQLSELLIADGINVTQATLSRDLKDLGVAKGSNGYVLAGAIANADQNEDVLHRTIKRELTEAGVSGVMVVLRTMPGHANSLAFEIDRSHLPEILGTIAGDDTIFITAKSQRNAQSLLRQFKNIADFD